MGQRDRYTEHRPLSSALGRHVSDGQHDPEMVGRYQREVYHQNRGIYFTEEQLKDMPWDIRGFIEAQGRRIFGPRRGRCNG